MNCKIDIDKFICFLIENKSDAKHLLETCLKSQGLEYKDGKIVEIDQPPLTDEQEPVTTPGSYDMKLVCLPGKPQTIKFNEPMTNTEKRYFSNMLFNDVRYKSIDFDKINIEKMVGEYKEGILISQSLTYDDLLGRAIAYKKGLEDMLKVIKEGE